MHSKRQEDATVERVLPYEMWDELGAFKAEHMWLGRRDSSTLLKGVGYISSEQAKVFLGGLCFVVFETRFINLFCAKVFESQIFSRFPVLLTINWLAWAVWTLSNLVLRASWKIFVTSKLKKWIKKREDAACSEDKLSLLREYLKWIY